MPKKETSKYASHLKKAQKVFDEATSGGGSVNRNIEDGKHEAKLAKMDIVEVAGGKKLMMQYTWIFDVDKKLLKKDKNAGLLISREGLDPERPQNFTFLKRRLDTFGYDSAEMNLAQDLPQICKEMTKKGVTCEVTVKTSDDGQYQNIWVNRMVDEGDTDDEDEDDSEDETEDEEESEDEDDSDEEDEEEDDEESDEDESDDDEEDGGDPELEKGNTVLYKPPRARKPSKFTVTKIKNGKADLKDEAGGIHKGILLENLELVESDDDEDDEDDEAESEFGEISKGSKLEVKDGKKTYKAVAVADPDDRKETVKVKFTDGPKKGKVVTVEQGNCELLD